MPKLEETRLPFDSVREITSIRGNTYSGILKINGSNFGVKIAKMSRTQESVERVSLMACVTHPAILQ